MKYLRLLVITMVTVSFSLVGCGDPKKGVESPTDQKQSQQSQSENSKQNSLGTLQGEKPLADKEDSVKPIVVSNAMEAIKALPQEEQVRRLRLELASIVGGAIFWGASYPLERAAERAALYYAVVRPINIGIDTFGKTLDVGLDTVQTADKRLYSAYLKGLKEVVANIKKAHPGMTTPEALSRIKNRGSFMRDQIGKEAGVMEKETAEKIAVIEKDAAREFVKSRRGYLVSRGFIWGSRGMRYLGIAATGVGTALLMYDLFSNVMTSEMGDGEIKAEDRLNSFERAMYNYRHDPENIHWQDELIKTCASSLPDIMEFLNLQIDFNKQSIEAIKNSSNLSEQDKRDAIASTEAYIKELNEKLELHKSLLGIISSENKEEALKKISEHADSLVELDKKAKVEPAKIETKEPADNKVETVAPVVSPSVQVLQKMAHPVN